MARRTGSESPSELNDMIFYCLQNRTMNPPRKRVGGAGGSMGPALRRLQARTGRTDHTSATPPPYHSASGRASAHVMCAARGPRHTFAVMSARLGHHHGIQERI